MKERYTEDQILTAEEAGAQLAVIKRKTEEEKAARKNCLDSEREKVRSLLNDVVWYDHSGPFEITNPKAAAQIRDALAKGEIQLAPDDLLKVYTTRSRESQGGVVSFNFQSEQTDSPKIIARFLSGASPLDYSFSSVVEKFIVIGNEGRSKIIDARSFMPDEMERLVFTRNMVEAIAVAPKKSLISRVFQSLF
ncbi:MAG: hypothetical protein PHQ59_04930 [Candidatus Daviesbacteria bacterium]|nr:hypothetical protein [Candidatus Daviesbacteria bacterium]